MSIPKKIRNFFFSNDFMRYSITETKRIFKIALIWVCLVVDGGRFDSKIIIYENKFSQEIITTKRY